MSYILDALRRANAERERERGAAPSIHAASAGLGTAVADAEDDERAPRWPWAVGALVVAGAAVVWWAPWRSPVAPTPPNPVVPRPVAQAGVDQPAVPSPAAGPPASAAQVTPPPVVVPVMPPPAPPAAPPAPPPAAAPRPAPAPPAAPTPAPAPVPAAPPAAPARVYAVHELPDDVRRSLPVLSIGGSIYADAPRDRLLILGGRLFHEGEQPAPGLTIERIKPRGAEFSFKGYRYEVPF